MRATRAILILAVVAAPPALQAVSNPPAGSGIDVHNGSCATPEPEILVSLTATDDVGVTGYHVSQSPAVPQPGDFMPVSPTTSFDMEVAYTIAGGFGKVTLYARFLDQDGNVSPALVYQLDYLDKEAVVDWTVLHGSVSSDAGLEVATDPAGNIYLTGFRFANPFFGGGDRALISKYDGSGGHQWDRSYSTSGGIGTGLTEGLDIVADASGNTYTAGYDLVDVLPDDTTVWEAFLVKFDTAGNLQWVDSLATAGTRNFGLGVALGPTGNPYMVGYTNGELPGETSAGGNDAFIARYDTAGNLQWAKQFGSSGTDIAEDIAVDGDGNLYVVGSAWDGLFGEPSLGPGSDIFLSKFDANGNEVWTRLMGTDRSPETARNVKLQNGSVYVAGGADDTHSSAIQDVFLAKYTTGGSHRWTRIFNGHTFASDEEAFGMAVGAYGAVYLVGSTWDPLDGNQPFGFNDIFVMKYGPTGKRLFTFTYGTGDSDRGFGAALAPNGKLLVTGYAGADLNGQTHLGSDDIVLLQLDLEEVAIPPDIYLDGFESGDTSGWN